MEALLATCEEDLAGIRDRALLLFGFASGGRRRSEIVAATLENVKRDGKGGFVFELRRSKTNQSGKSGARELQAGRVRGSRGAGAWLQELFRAKIIEGGIFRRIHNGVITEPSRDAAVREIILRRAKLVDPPLGKLSAVGICYRIGYYRTGEVVHSGAARLMDDPKEE